MKLKSIGNTGIKYIVEIEGLKGDDRVFCECQYWENKAINNKLNAINYAKKKRDIINMLGMKNKITITEVCGNNINIIMEV